MKTKWVSAIMGCYLLGLAPIAMAETAQRSASEPVGEIVPPSTWQPARIRLFGQNGTTIKLYKNTSCSQINMNDPIWVSGGLGSSFMSFLHLASNESIGMPETENTREIAKRDGYLSKAYYKEYELAAGTPVVVELSAVAVESNWYCPGADLNFLAEPGANYEVVQNAQLYSGGRCVRRINKINPDGSLTPAHTSICPTSR